MLGSPHTESLTDLAEEGLRRTHPEDFRSAVVEEQWIPFQAVVVGEPRSTERVVAEERLQQLRRRVVGFAVRLAAADSIGSTSPCRPGIHRTQHKDPVRPAHNIAATAPSSLADSDQEYRVQ